MKPEGGRVFDVLWYRIPLYGRIVSACVGGRTPTWLIAKNELAFRVEREPVVDTLR